MDFPFAMSTSLRPHADGSSTGAPVHEIVRSGPAPGSLQPQQIELDVDVSNVKHALQMAAELICRAHGLDSAPVFRALWRREQIGSTAIGHGVALPHARISGIAKPLMLFMRPKYAIEFGAPDGRLVNMMWVILVPVDGSAEDHLDLLAAVARASSDVRLRAHLDSAATADDAARVFSDWTTRQLT